MWSLGGSVLLAACFSFTHGQSDIRMPPSITKGPLRTVIYRSEDSVTLECKGGGVPAVTYDWKKNGFDMNQNLPNIQRGADGSMTITPASSVDEGYYQCFVRNQYGVALSNVSHIQRALLDSVSGTPSVLQKTVKQGEPFHIQAVPRKSFPKPTYGWEIADDTVDKSPTPFTPSNRVQIAENGDLYFAYALPDDELINRIYKCTTYNQYLDIKAGGSYTKITVTRDSAGEVSFAPTLGFSSDVQTVAVVGGTVTLRCFFSGNPVPSLSWKGPGNTLPIGRYTLGRFNTELTITDIQAKDQGDYVCTASNTRGNNQHTLQLRVEGVPSFKNLVDGPLNSNATDGGDAVFNCNTEATPEANVVWFRNDEIIDVNSPPKRFVFSNNRKTLTIKDVCRSCDDPTRETDLAVIQCNASNIHGYAFGSAYLNILKKTEVIPAETLTVPVGMYEEKRIDFECRGLSDPSTTPSLRWYKVVESKEKELVHESLPTITLRKEDGESPSLTLSIYVSPNGTEKWETYHGDYQCEASNGYSQATRVVRVEVKEYIPPAPQVATIADWWWIFIIIALFLILLIIILCCCIYCQRNKGDKYDVDEKERKNGNDPEKELLDGDFKDYRRPEGQTLKGSRGSLGSSVKLNSDEEASLNEYGDDPGKFTEDGSFVGAYSGGTVDRKKGRNQ